MRAVDLLGERNGRFVGSGFHQGLTMRPKIPAMVITCLDPRVDPAHVLGLELGDAPVIRNVGGRVTPAVLEQLQLLGLLSGSARVDQAERWDLVVMQHDDCGITRMTADGPRLASYLGLSEQTFDADEVRDPVASVRRDLARLGDIPALRGGFDLVGLVYEVGTGRVRVVDDAAAPDAGGGTGATSVAGDETTGVSR